VTDGSAVTDDAGTSGSSGPSLAGVWGYWLSVGWAALLAIACLAVVLGWTGLEDALDARRWFR